MKEIHPLTRFSSRAAQYHSRPMYPPGLLDYLHTECKLKRDQVIADIGSGTGYLTRVFLDNGNRVFAVEPNDNMRAVAESSFGSTPLFTSIKGIAEAIPLAKHSVDVVSVGQALHWFDVDEARKEFLRVLRAGGWIVVVDMRTRDDANELMRDYAAFRKTHFENIGTASEPPIKITRLFEGYPYTKKEIPTPYVCTEQAFCDGTLSSSLAPEFGTMEYQKAQHELQTIFRQYQVNRRLKLDFETVVWSAKVDSIARG